MLRRKSHGSQKLEKNSVGGRGEGGIAGGGAGGRCKGGSPGAGRPWLLFPPPKFNSAAAAQKEVSGAMAQSANPRGPR